MLALCRLVVYPLFVIEIIMDTTLYLCVIQQHFVEMQEMLFSAVPSEY